MKRFLIPAIVIASAIVSSTAFAEPATYGKTRAEVRAKLIQAREAGGFNVADSTYPAAQVAASTTPQPANAVVPSSDASAVGGVVTGRTQSGRRTVTAPEARDSIYFGQ
jgi:hypothetical protein